MIKLNISVLVTLLPDKKGLLYSSELEVEMLLVKTHLWGLKKMSSWSMEDSSM